MIRCNDMNIFSIFVTTGRLLMFIIKIDSQSIFAFMYSRFDEVEKMTQTTIRNARRFLRLTVEQRLQRWTQPAYPEQTEDFVVGVEYVGVESWVSCIYFLLLGERLQNKINKFKDLFVCWMKIKDCDDWEGTGRVFPGVRHWLRWANEAS